MRAKRRPEPGARGAAALASGHATPEQLTALAGEMAAVAEEAAAWGCGGVAAEARLRARDIAEAARYAQEGETVWEQTTTRHLPPADYMVLAGSLAFLGIARKTAQFLKMEAISRWLARAQEIQPASWPGVGVSLIWVDKCDQVVMCRGWTLGTSPKAVSVKWTQGWFDEPAPTCDEMALFFQEAKAVEGGYIWGIADLRTDEFRAFETGFYSPQISMSGFLPSKCEVVWEEKP